MSETTKEPAPESLGEALPREMARVPMRECDNCGALLFGRMSINGMCRDCNEDQAELSEREESHAKKNEELTT